jgi:DUF917 family protein
MSCARRPKGSPKAVPSSRRRTGSTLKIRFQNEHLVARADGRLFGIVPDLICVLDGDTAEPITAEAIRYGQRSR